MPKTHSYHDYLIKSLEEIEESAAYIQAILAWQTGIPTRSGLTHDLRNSAILAVKEPPGWRHYG
jgi:hypothetical protein